MMKKLTVLLCSLLCSFVAFGQGFPNRVESSNAQTMQVPLGAVAPGKSIIVPVLDTLNNVAVVYRGALTVRPQDSLLYMSDGVRWHPFVSSTNGFVIDSVYVERPLAVKIGTSGAATGKQVIYFLKESGLISGGIPLSTGCRTLTMPPSIYIINYNQYTSISTNLTIDTSSATLNRTDRIVGDTFGIISVIKGTPSSLGLPPTYNPSSQFSLQLISIPAAATCTPATNFSTTLYDENLGVAGGEWDVTTTGTISADRNNTDNPLNLIKAIFVATYTDSSQIVLTHTALQDTVTSSSVLVLPTYLNIRLTNPIQVQLFLNTTSVSNNTVINSYINPLDTGHYQLPVIPFSAFGVNSQIYNKVVITFRGSDISGAGGLYFDWIRIQKGINGFDQLRYVDSVSSVNVPGRLTYYKGGIAYDGGALGSTNTNLGAGFRLAVHGTNGIKTIFGSNTIGLDSSSNTNGITIKADTSLLATQYDISSLVNSAGNGLTDSSNRVILGGTLYKNTVISTQPFGLSLNGTTVTPLLVNSTTGIAMQVYSSNVNAIHGLSDLRTGGYFETGSATYEGLGAANSSSNNTAIKPILRLESYYGFGATVNGFGGSIDYFASTASSGTPLLQGKLRYKWTDVTDATRTAEYSITALNSGTEATLATFSGNGAVQFNAYTAGTATFDGSGNITSVSDKRVKHNIKPFTYGLDAIMKLRTSTFIYNKDKSNTVMSGFIAQDVQRVIPIAVHKGNDGMLSLETNAILAALVNAVKEQQQQIEDLEKEIKALKKK